MKKHFFVVAAVIISSQLNAQDTSAISLDGIVLTANKFPKKQSETGKVLIVIDRNQIERSGGKTLSELLNTGAGVTMIGANNNLGNNISPVIRGAATGNVLILLDGIPANDPSVISNIFDLNFISLDQVERIEILKGGQSTLYGSDAVGGVINIISKRAANKKISVYGNFSGGSYHTLRQSVGLSSQGNKAGFSVDYSHINSEGFSAAHDTAKTVPFDDDGYNQHALTGRFNLKAGKHIKANFSGTFSNYKTDLDASAFKDDRDYTAENINKQAGAGLTYTYSKGEIRANYSFNRSERNYLNEPLHISDPGGAYIKSNYIGRSHFAELYGNLRLDHWEIVAGADYRGHNTDQSYYSDGIYGPYSSFLTGKMKQVSPYASVMYKKETGFNAELGGRVNIHSGYGNTATFTFNPFYQMENRNKIFANLYSSFKVPTLYQLFDAFAGNPDLEAEKGITGEIGFEMRSVPALKTRITGFYRNTSNAILYTSNPLTFESKYLNAAKQINYGAELEIGYTKEKKEFSFNYTYTDGKTTASFDGTGAPLTKDTTYFNLYRIPKHAINLSAGYHTTKTLFVRADIHTISKRDEYIYAGAPEILKGYTLIDLYGEYRFGKVAKVFLDLKNISNKKYFDFLGYNTRRFNFTTGIRFQL